MITGIKEKNRKNDIIFLSVVIFVFLFVLWLCTPPGNKFAQMCFFGNNTQYFIAKYIKHDNVNEYVFHRDNAVYLAQMDDEKSALKSIDKALAIIPPYADEREYQKLYMYKAQILFYFKDYKGAANSYLKAGNLGMMDNLKMALALRRLSKNKYAVSYCNNILDVNNQAYIGYACLADVYAGIGRYDVCIKLFNLLLEGAPNHAQYYSDRAEYRKLAGDISGYNEDIQKAKKLNSGIMKSSSIIDKTLNARGFVLSEI